MTRAISLAALTVLEVSPVETVRIAAACGYSHVGLRPIAATPVEAHFSLLGDAALRRETLSALADCGIGVLDVEILRLKPDTRPGDFESALAFGAEAGARFALVAGNDPDRVRSADTFAALCDLAASFGIRPHLEFMPWTDVPDIATAQQIAAAASRANAGVLVDAFHLNRSGGVSGDVPQDDPAIGYLQLCDIAGPVPAMDEILREARSDRLFPDEGEIDLVALLQRLPDRPVSIEVPADRLRNAGVGAEDRARLAISATRKVLDRADRA